MGEVPGGAHSSVAQAVAARWRQAVSLLLLAAAVVWVVWATVQEGRSAMDSGAGRVEVGAPAPDFRLQMLDGGAATLAGYRGRPLVLNFFASWCDPCREEAPVVASLADGAAAGGYAVLGVAVLDERAPLLQFLRNEGLESLPVALDNDNKVARAYQLLGPPATFFIDAGGVIRDRVSGPLTAERAAAGLALAAGAAGAADGGTVPADPAGAEAGGLAGMAGAAAGATGAAGLALALAAGLLSFLSPCTLPLLPAYLGFISGVSVAEWRGGAREARRRMVGRTVAFAAGLLLVFVVLGASASLVGGWLTAHRALLARVAGVAVLAFGLHMLGWLRIAILQREYRPGLAVGGAGAGGAGGAGGVAGGRGAGSGVLGAMGLGAAFAFGWSPCVGPMLGSILLLASQEQTVARGMLLLAAYGVGLGLPFVLAGVAADRALSAAGRLHRHMGWLARTGGALLVAMGVLLVLDRLGTLAAWLNRVL